MADAPAAQPVKRRAPTLWAIIIIKLGKGALLVLLALGVYSLSNDDLPQELARLLHFLRLDPETQFFAELGAKLEQITPTNVRWVAAGTVLYSLFSLVEGTGLMFRVTWACWLTIGETAFFIPIEVYELIRKASLGILLILVLNIGIVTYLAVNRNRLFHKHTQPHQP